MRAELDGDVRPAARLHHPLSVLNLVEMTLASQECTAAQFGPLLQVMPWPAYANMTEHDLRAIYEYLSAIPHAEPGSIGP